MVRFSVRLVSKVEKIAVYNATKIKEVIDTAVKKLGGKPSDDYGLFLDDGAMLCEDSDLGCILQGECLIVAKSCQEVMASSSGYNKRAKVDDADDYADSQESVVTTPPGSPSGSTSTVGFPVSPIAKVSPTFGDSDTSSSSSESTKPLPLPTFTDAVRNALEKGDSTTVWNLAIEQMMHFYLKHYPDRLNGSKVYKLIGKAMYEKYPCIKRDGKHPWSCLTRILSGRVRTYRWASGKKNENFEESSEIIVHTSTKGQDIAGNLLSVGSLSDYFRNSAEAKKEFATQKPSKTHLKLLQKESFSRRQQLLLERDAAGEDMVPKLLEEWPMFKYGSYLMDELKMKMGKTDREMAELRSEATKAVQVLKSMITTDKFKNEGDKKVLDVLDYVMVNTTYKKGTGIKAVPCWVEKSDVPCEKIDANIKSSIKEAPKLYLFFKGNNFDIAEVAADKCIIHLQAGDTTNALVGFLSTYFAFHVGYPAVYAQMLGFMQQALLGVPYDGKKSVQFTQFMHKFDQAMKNQAEKIKFKPRA